MLLPRFLPCLFLLHCLLGGLLAFGQNSAGIPPVRMYLPNEYNAHSQNFALTQDKRGLLYVGNYAGVLEFDGLSWRTISTQDTTKVSALLTTRRGTVCVGANGEFGYLRPDSLGTAQFVSLSRSIKTPFTEVLAVLETADGIFFVARSAIFRWKGKSLTEMRPVRPIVSAFTAGGTIYLLQQQTGLCMLSDNSITPLARETGTARLYDLLAMLPLNNGQSLLLTSSQGLFRLINNRIEPFDSDANTYLTANQATGGTVLADGSLAITTLRGGLVLLTPNGQRQQILRDIQDLNDQPVNSLYTDSDANLWLALNNGLAQLTIPSPLTQFQEPDRSTGEVMDVRRVNNTVYVATLNGLFRVDETNVLPFTDLTVSCFSLAEAAGALWVATSKGVYEVRNGQARPVTPGDLYTLSLTPSRANPSRLYVGTESGLGVLTVGAGPVQYRIVPGLTEQIFGIREDIDGTVWLETLRSGLYRYTPANGQFKQYAVQQGLPTLLYNRVFRTRQGLLVSTQRGTYRYDPATDRFVAHNPVDARATASAFWKNTLVEARNGDLWTVEGNKKRITRYQKTSNNFRAVNQPFLPMANVPINVIYPDANGVIWFGGRDGLVRYDSKVAKNYAQPYPALIRRIEITGDKPLFGGYDELAEENPTDIPELAYQSNDIRFEFTAVSYAVNNLLTFQSRLEDYDPDWSEWTSASKREYTNLPPGRYTFRVRARNLYGTPSQEAAFTFRVLPPWYGRWWVIGLLLAGAGGLVYGLVRWRLSVLEREKQALENLIQERTEEVVYQKEELEKQSEELAVKNDQLEKIDLIVQSINAEIDLSDLFQTILTKFSVIRNMDSASFLVYDKSSDAYRFKALRGNHDLAHVADAPLTAEQAESRYLTQAVEVYRDIYLKNDVQYELLDSPIDDLATPRSLITIVMENEGHIEGFITLENTSRAYAFDERDLSMIRNLKEHLIAAFIKTRLLEDLETTLANLKNTQDELIRQERLASVGQLTKGIVDRILNPLNYVQNFSQSSDGLIQDVIGLIDQHAETLPEEVRADLLDELEMIKKNLLKIREHSDSTTRILKDMQRLLREKSPVFLETDLNSFIESKARTALQEVRVEYKDFTVDLVLDLTKQPVRTRILPNELGQVVQNIISNAYYTLYEKSRLTPGFVPQVRIATETTNGQVCVCFRDNGKGIPQREIDKLFSPFYTTKPTAKGTGLGLFMTKDIIESHKGKITIQSQEGEFTELMVILPTVSSN